MGKPVTLGKNRTLLTLRGLFGLAALSCFFFALTRLPLADATVIHYTHPVFTAVMAALFLSEGLGGREIAGALLSMAAVVLVAQPASLFGSGADLPLLCVGIAVLGAFFSTSPMWRCASSVKRSIHSSSSPTSP